MNIWRILGIDPTADRAAITAAYRSKLSGANPEDDPEAFKQLRAAYEQALALAKQAAAANTDTSSDSERWIAHVDAIYQDIHRRRDENEWRALLAEEYCAQPVNRVQARDQLLSYLAEHCFLPHRIWLLLEETFQLRQSAEELREIFPPAFIDNVMLAGIEHTEQIPYDPLECGGGADCDGYLRACAQCMRALGDGQAERAKDLFQQMESSGVSHPYTQLCRARLALLDDRPEEAQALVAAVLELLPGDTQALLLDAQLAMESEEYARAEEELRQVLAESPRLAQAKYDLAGCLSRSGRKREAKTLYLELLRALPFNRMVMEAVTQVNRELLPELEQRFADCPQDAENTSELAWCYHQLQEEEAADATIAHLPAEAAGTADYENLAAKVKLARGEWADALAHLRAWEAALRRQEPVDPVRLPESMRLQACALFSLGEQEPALELLTRISDQWPEDGECWKLRAQFLLQQNRLEEALDTASRYREASPSDPASAFLCGEVLFRMRRLQEAYHAFQEAMELLGGRDAGCLIFQCRILMLVNQWEDAKALLQQLLDAGITDPSVVYCQAQLANHEHRTSEALQHYQALVPVCRGENPPDFAGEVFFRLVCLQYDSLSKTQLLQLVEEGLRLDSQSVSLLDLKVDLLQSSGQIAMAVDACRELCLLYPGHPSAFETLGRLLQFYQRDFAGAVKAYQAQLKNRESAALHNYLGLCLQELEQFSDAETHFSRALTLSPRCSAFLANLAELYLIQKRYLQAESTYRAALSLPNPRARDRIQMRRRLSLLLRRTGNWEGAVEALNPNIQQEYQYDDCRRQAEIWEQAGQPDRAIQALKSWKKLAHPEEAVYLLRKAALLRQLGRERAALRALRRGAQSSRDCLMALGELYIAREQYQKAAAVFRRLSQEMPGEDDLLDRLAKCQLWSGDAVGAAETAKRGLDVLERNRSLYNKAMYYTRRAALLLTSGETEQAQAALKKAESSPFCEACAYPVCKDAIGVRILLLEQAGQLAQAAGLCQDAGQHYPDEMDFPVYGKRIRKKMEQRT